MGEHAGSAWAGACLLFLALHAAAVLLDPSGGDAYGYPFVIAAPLLGMLAVRRLGRGSTATVRLAWRLLAAGFAVWDCGTVTAARNDLLLGLSPLVANLADVFYIAYGVAIVAALALPDRRALVRRMVWIDVAQGVLAAGLCYVAVFSSLPLLHLTGQPASSTRMVNLYMVENLALLAVAGLRVLGRSRSPSRAAFDRVVLIFLASYAACAGAYNAYVVRISFSAGLMQLLVDLPFLGLLLLRPAAAPSDTAATAQRRRPLTLLVDGATPALFTLALLWLSMSIAQTRFTLGAAAMAASVLLMVVRSALLESHHLQVQDALALVRDRLLRLSLHDDLTGISNRRAFQAALSEHWGPGQQHGAAPPLSLLLIDIDHFKAINDRLGHEAGDTCLRMVAATLGQSLDELAERTGCGGVAGAGRRGESRALFRYGGEEFAVLLPDTSPGDACQVAETLRAGVFRLAIPNRTATGDRVTISIGVASTAHGHDTPSRLVSGADRALYEAKAGGRNKVAADGTVPAGIVLER